MDVWRCLEITSSDGKTFVYDFEQILGESIGEMKQVEGRDGLYQVNALYDDSMRPLPDVPDPID